MNSSQTPETQRDIRAIYFDLDDTLCAYWAASRKGLREAFEESGIDVEKGVSAWRKVFSTFSPEIKTERWYEHYLESGEPTRTEHMRRVLEEMGQPDAERAKALSSRYATLRDSHLALFPESQDVLAFLKDSGQFKLGLITNGPADVQRQEIVTLGIGGFFDHILIEGEFKLGKPHLQIFAEACAKWGLQPSQMLFVGNAFEHDVQGAKRAGWHALWVNKAEEENPGTQPQPDEEIVDLWEVIDWLGIRRPGGAKAEPTPRSLTEPGR
jgi:putative hydrolase of the HAD superfamily